MVRALADGEVRVSGTDLRLVQSPQFPKWLGEGYPELEDDYPRIAVSLGGARQKVINRSGVAKVTAGDVKVPPKLGGYYVKGNWVRRVLTVIAFRCNCSKNTGRFNANSSTAH